MVNYVRIPNIPDNAHHGPEYTKWVKESYAKIGYNGGDYLFTGTPPWDFAWIDGSLYRRDGGGKFFYGGDREKNQHEVICECGNFIFEIFFGNYELIAKCSKCGTEEAVYSG